MILSVSISLHLTGLPAPVRLDRNRCRAPHAGELLRVLDEAHLVEQGAHVVQPLGSLDAGTRLRAHRVHVHVARAAVLADDLALVDGDARSYEERRALLDVEEAVGGRLPLRCALNLSGA